MKYYLTYTGQAEKEVTEEEYRAVSLGEAVGLKAPQFAVFFMGRGVTGRVDAQSQKECLLREALNATPGASPERTEAKIKELLSDDDLVRIGDIPGTNYSLYRKPNGVGGFVYMSDEIPPGVVVWDTALCSASALVAALQYEVAPAKHFSGKDSIMEKSVQSSCDIGWAIGHINAGKYVTRRGWNGKGQHLGLRLNDPPNPSLPDGSGGPERGFVGMSLPYVYIKTVQGDTVPWLCSQTDLLATDWEEVELSSK